MEKVGKDIEILRSYLGEREDNNKEFGREVVLEKKHPIDQRRIVSI
jgi:hypothetical protein